MDDHTLGQADLDGAGLASLFPKARHGARAVGVGAEGGDQDAFARQLQPTPAGIPLQVYCFTRTTKWVEYEGIQADIFDHLLAILPTFDLRVFQQCSDVTGMPTSNQSVSL